MTRSDLAPARLRLLVRDLPNVRETPSPLAARPGLSVQMHRVCPAAEHPPLAADVDHVPGSALERHVPALHVVPDHDAITPHAPNRRGPGRVCATAAGDARRLRGDLLTGGQVGAPVAVLVSGVDGRLAGPVSRRLSRSLLGAVVATSGAGQAAVRPVKRVPSSAQAGRRRRGLGAQGCQSACCGTWEQSAPGTTTHSPTTTGRTDA